MQKKIIPENKENQNSYLINNYEIDDNKYILIDDEKITESDINNFFNNYPPSKESEKIIIIKPIKHVENFRLYYGE